MEKKSWKGGVIYVAADGTIERVEDRAGNEIRGEEEVAVPGRVNNPNPLIFFRDAEDDEERCVYGANGRCYCS